MEKKTVTIGNVTFGEGLPKIIVPVAEDTERKIYARMTELRFRQANIVEWRADFYEDVHDHENVLKVLKKSKKLVDKTPVIFTCRSDQENGAVHMEKEEYLDLYEKVIRSGYTDIIDIETERYEKEVRELVKLAHEHGVKVMGSDVYPEITPSRQAIIDCMIRMQELDVDILKIAVLTHNAEEMLRLLDAAREVVEKHASRPVIAMGMGSAGVLSRIACETIGTCATYGAFGGGTAEGQFQVERLDSAIRILHAGITAKYDTRG